MGFLFVGSVGVVPQWFTKRRSVANGIATGGSGLGCMMYSLASNAMIQRLGIGWTFRILGIISFTVNFVCAILIKDRNKAIGATQLAFDYRLFKRVEFLLTLGWGFFSMLGYIVLLFSLPNYAISIGLTAKQGSITGALLNLGQGLGRPVVGIFSDSAGRINIAGFLTFACGVFCFIVWIFAKSFGVLIFFSIIVGTVAGTFWTTVGPVGAEVVGLKELPSALSIMWIMLVIPTTCKSLTNPHDALQFTEVELQFQSLSRSNSGRAVAISTSMPRSSRVSCTPQQRSACGFCALGRLVNWSRSQHKQTSPLRHWILSLTSHWIYHN